MITMVDEIYDRGYQAGRSELHAGIDSVARKLRRAIMPAFEALHRLEWDAPWSSGSDDKAKA